MAEEWNLPIDGECRCGNLRIRINAPPLLTMACHCTGCQKMSASAFSLSAAFPSNAFEIAAGKPVLGGLRGDASHYFCPDCMTWMFTRMVGMDWFVNVRSTMLSEPARFAPFVETYTCEKLPFAQTGASHSFEKFPPMEAYEHLTAEYAAG